MPAPHAPSRVLTTGNQMVARAAIDAGCRFFAGYPITPASQIYREMTQILPGIGGVAMAAPDEISSVALCLGASLRGDKAMTATSGPGWALMIENIGYALMSETPVVVAVVQRLGPSTGAATQGAQGDLGLVYQAVSGGYCFPVFAPSTAAESYEDCLRAFEWSERLRTPVVLLSDKEVASTTEVVDLRALPEPSVVERRLFEGEDFRTYGFDRPEEVPGFAPVGGGHPVAITGSSHDKIGRLKKNDPETLEMLAHLRAKLDAAEPELGQVDWDEEKEATTLILSFGVTARAARDAVVTLRGRGKNVSLAVVRTLFPIPVTALQPILSGVEQVLVVEENHSGQYRNALAPFLGAVSLRGVNSVGALIRPEEIVHACC